MNEDKTKLIELERRVIILTRAAWLALGSIYHSDINSKTLVDAATALELALKGEEFEIDELKRYEKESGAW